MTGGWPRDRDWVPHPLAFGLSKRAGFDYPFSARRLGHLPFASLCVLCGSALSLGFCSLIADIRSLITFLFRACTSFESSTVPTILAEPRFENLTPTQRRNSRRNSLEQVGTALVPTK